MSQHNNYVEEGSSLSATEYPWAERITDFREALTNDSPSLTQLENGLAMAVMGYEGGKYEKRVFASYVTLAMLADRDTARDALFQVECYTNGTYN